MSRRLVLVSVLATGCAGEVHVPPPGPPLERVGPSAAPAPQVSAGSDREVVLDDRDGLSPDEAAILAVDRNPLLTSIRAARGLGEAQVLAAKLLPNPRLSASQYFPVSGDEARVLGYGVGVSWNVSPLFSRRARVSAADAGLRAIDLEVAWQEWQVAQTARLHAVRAIYVQRRAAVAAELEQSWQARRDALRDALEARAVTQLEVTNAEHAFADARVRRLALDEQVVAVRADLNVALGVDTDAVVIVDVSYAPSEVLPEAAPLLDALPERRLDLVALQHAHRSHDEALRAATIARFPPISVGFDVGRDVDNVGYAGITLGIDVPLFDRNQPAVAAERARRTQAGADYASRLLEVRATVERLADELAVVREQVLAAREASSAAERLAAQAQAAAVQGALSPLLAADALQRAYDDRLRALELEQRFAELQVGLAAASGTDLGGSRASVTARRASLAPSPASPCSRR